MHYEGENLKFWQFEEKKRGQYEKKCIMKGKCRDRTIYPKNGDSVDRSQGLITILCRLSWAIELNWNSRQKIAHSRC